MVATISPTWVFFLRFFYNFRFFFVFVTSFWLHGYLGKFFNKLNFKYFATKICDKIPKAGENYFNFPFYIIKLYICIWHVVHENWIFSNFDRNKFPSKLYFKRIFLLNWKSGD